MAEDAKLSDLLAEAYASGDIDLERPAALPGVPAPTENISALVRTVRALKTVVDTLTGAAGDVTRRALTARDLLRDNVMTYSPSTGLSAGGTTIITVPGGGGGGGGGGGDDYEDPRPVLSVPPAPTDLSVRGAFSNVLIDWGLLDYRNHAFTEVLRHTVDNPSLATVIGTAVANQYTDATASLSTVYYYWVRAVNTEGVTGPLNAAGGTPGGRLLIGNVDLGPLIVEAGNLASGAVNAGHLAANTIAVGTLAVQNGAIVNAMIANLAVDNAKIANSTIQTAKIADLAVTTAKIADLTVTAAKIASLAVSTAKIGDLAVTEGKIANLAVTDAKIANLAVTNAKIASVSAAKLTAGSIAVGEHIQSSTYVSGTSGWRISGSGALEMNDGTFRGTLSAVTGSFGAVTVGGALTMKTTGHVKGGQTAYDTGTGFFLGYSGGSYKFSIGNATKAMLWDGSALTIRGAVVGTENVVRHAIIQPRVAQATYSTSFSTNTVVLSVFDVTVTDFDVMLIRISMDISTAPSTGLDDAYVARNTTVRLKRGASTILTLTARPFGVPGSALVAHEWIDQPGAGTYDYTVELTATSGGTGGVVSNRTLSVLLLKNAATF